MVEADDKVAAGGARIPWSAAGLRLAISSFNLSLWIVAAGTGGTIRVDGGGTETLCDLVGDIPAVSLLMMNTPRKRCDVRVEGRLYPSIRSVKSGDGSEGRRGTR